MKNGKLFYGWVVVAGCLLITMTMVPPVMALSGKFQVAVTTELGISQTEFTLANTILQGLGIFISPIIAGKLAKGNMKMIQCIGIVGFAVCYASYALAQNQWMLYVSSIFIGIFWLMSALIPVSMMITNWFVKSRGLAMSIAMAGIGIGGMIFSPILTSLLGQFGWRMTYVIFAVVVCVIALPSALFLCKKSPADMGLTALGADEVDESAKTPKKKVTMSLSVKDSWKQIFFWCMLIGMLCNGLINSGALGQFPRAITLMQGESVQAVIISMYSGIGIIGKLFLGWVNDKFGVIASAATGCILFAASFIFMFLGAANVSMLYIMAVLFGLGDAIGTVTPPLVTAAVFGQEKYGEAYGVANSFTQVGLTFGSLMVASIYDLSGAYTPAWILLFVLTIVAMFGWCFSILMSKKYRTEETIEA